MTSPIPVVNSVGGTFLYGIILGFGGGLGFFIAGAVWKAVFGA